MGIVVQRLFLLVALMISTSAIAQTPRLQPYLLGSEFQDGQPAGSITPSDLRDLISSTYPSNFRVVNYGAKCDGKILNGTVGVTAGSPVISSSVYQFTQADVGSTIDVFVTPFNSHSTSVTSFNSTIISVANGQATMAASSPYSNGGSSARWYHTVDTTAIQSALTAASSSNVPGGATVEFPPGVCATGQLTFGSNTRIVGAGWGASVLLLANGSNSDMFVGQGFSSLTGTNSPGGIHNFSFENIQLDGNRGANSGTGIGGASGTGNGVRFYGYEFSTSNLLINNFAGDGWYSEWSTTAGNPIDANGALATNGMEPHIHDIKSFYNSGWGMVYAGSHDAQMSHAWFVSNGTGGILSLGIGSPLVIDHMHTYQNGGNDIDIEAPYLKCMDCYIEGTALYNSYYTYFINSTIGILKLGVTSGPAVYGLNMVNTTVTTINNVTGSTFNDSWINGSVGSITGSSYSPISYATLGLTTMTPTLRMVTGSSYAVNMGTNGASQFTIANGGATFGMDAGGNSYLNGNLYLGPNALTLSQGAFGLNKINASGTAPGAAGGKIELVCSATTGKAKLIVYAGTSTTSTTLLDGIGSGVSGC